MPYYAVARGRVPGIYQTSDECKRQTDKFPDNRYKSFLIESEAKLFIEKHQDYISSKSSRKNAQKDGQILANCISVKGTAGECSGPCIVYIDGACHNNRKRGAKGGIGVFWGPGHPDNVSQPLPLLLRQSNNIAEMRAAVRAIEQAKEKGHKELTIPTDSKFLIQSATEWLNRWQNNGWRLVDDGPVKNKADLLMLISACEGMDKIVWEKVSNLSLIAH